MKFIHQDDILERIIKRGMDFSVSPPLQPLSSLSPKTIPSGQGGDTPFSFPKVTLTPEKTPPQNASQPIRIVITLPTHSYFTSGLRELSRVLAQNMSGFSEQWAYRFQSVVDELVNNAIEFGSRPGESIEITFLSLMNHSIEVFVKDTGTGPGTKTIPEIEAFVEERKNTDPTTITGIRGRGLAQIVSKWVDLLQFQANPAGGITAHVVKNFEKDEALLIPV